MQISAEVCNQLAAVLQKEHGFATTAELDRAVLAILEKTAHRQHERKNTFSLSTAIRGMRALKGEALNSATSAADVDYLKALSTGSTPGFVN